MENEKKTNRTILRKILRYLLSAVLTVLILLSLAFLIFSIYKDDIARQLVMALNERQSGEITLKEISLKPFKYFPDVSLQLEDVEYYREKSAVRPDSVQPIISLSEIYFALDILDLLKGRLNVKDLSLHAGRINLIQTKEGTINIADALGLTDVPPAEETEEAGEEGLMLSAEKIELTDLYIMLENRSTGNSIDFYIVSFDASLAFGGQLDRINLNTDIVIISYSSSKTEFLNDNSISLNADMYYMEEDSVFNVKNSRLTFDGAEFIMNGSVNIKNGGDLDLKISGSDKDFSFFSLILREDALLQNRKNLKEGDIYFDGILKGNVSKEIPYAEFTFGMNDVRLDLPVMNSSIKDLNLTGYFTTGKAQDLSEAQLLLENFNADLPDGSTKGSLRIKNFVSPHVELDFFLNTDITGYDKIFKIDYIDNLGGTITIQEKLYGYLDKRQKRFMTDTVEAEILFEDVSVNFPDELSLDKINGKITRDNDRYVLDNLHIISENTDVRINGIADNILMIIFDAEADVTADLKIESNKFVFPEVFAFDTSAARDFHYTFNNLVIDVQAKSTVSKLLNFNDFPDIDFNLRNLSTGFKKLPDIKNMSGRFSMFEDPFSFNIKFDDLSFNTSGGKYSLNGQYIGAEYLPLYLKTNLEIKNLDLRDHLMQFEMDVDTASFLDAELSCSMYTEIQFSREDEVFETFTINNLNFEYILQPDQDTVSLEKFKMNFRDIDYNLDIDPNPLASLTAAGKIEIGKVSSSEFLIDEPAYDISIINGKYTLIPLKSSLFGKQGEGIFYFDPWADIPNYKWTYSIKQFEIENFLTSFLEDSVLTGKMDLSLDISMQGDDWENMLSHIDGNIYLSGSDLTLYGLDVDKLLERVARSQNFNLVDVSAVLLAGPVGLAVTKGTDLASIVILSPGEKTKLPKLLSVWNMENGHLEMTDIAFTSNNHRIVAKGFIDLGKKNLDVTIAQVNKDGCIVLSQTVSGNLEDPETGDIKVLQSLLSPVTNLWNSITGKECEKFYFGSVEHPK